VTGPTDRLAADDLIEDEEQILSVGDLATLVKEGLNNTFPEDLWVEGQVSGFHDAQSGHAYFDLVEPSDIPGRAVGAKFSVALFKGSRASVDRTLGRAGGLKLANDLLLRIRARLEFYTPNGRLQLIMNGADPSFTLGQLAAERDRLLRTLLDEGLLRANRALPVPVPPLCIGLVTSVGSAAHADFTDELMRSQMPFVVLECDSRVQGDGAAIDLAESILMVASHQPDVVAVVRGGGSAVDLAAFDAEVLARTIATLGTPVVTGIGHEIDRSVADEVAHTSFKTPTACAASLVGQVRLYSDNVDTLGVAITTRASTAMERADDLLQDLTARTTRSATTRFSQQDDRLHALTARLRALDPAEILARGWSITRQEDGTLIRSTDDVTVGVKLITTITGGEVASTVGSVSAHDMVVTESGEDGGLP